MQYKRGWAWLFLCALCLLAATGCATTAAAPATKAASGGTTLHDQLADFSKMASHSVDLDFDIKNPAAWPNGDASRIWPTTGEPQYFVYQLKDISGFSFVVGYYTYKHQDNPAMHGFKAYLSADGKDWKEAASKAESADNGCWLFTTWKPAAEIPAASNFVKFEFFDKDLHWSTEVSEVQVSGR